MFLAVALLASLPCVARRVSFRLCEVLWLGVIITAVVGGHVTGFAEQREMLAECQRLEHSIPDAGFCAYDICKGTRVNKLLLRALALDTLVTISHLALPVRWSLMVWVDVLVLLCFAHLYMPLATHADQVALPAMFAGLVLGACFGLRSSEHRERVLFAKVTDERVLRVEAELIAERAKPARSKRPDDAGSTSLASTMGMFLGHIQATGCSSHELSFLQEMGRREHWLIEPGELVIHRQRILGRGSFGVVCQGRFCCGVVAVKTCSMNDSSLIDPSFFTELRVLRQLRHPNIILFYGVEIDAGACGLNLVLERVYGITLSVFISRPQDRLEQRGILSPELLIAQGLCQALAYLHSRKPCIVHGDLKPTNVMVEDIGQIPKAKLLDFGLARVAGRNQTVTGGTLMYAAPEILEGGRPCKPDAAVDVFALGKTLFFIASGRTPAGMLPSDLPWAPPTKFLNSWGETIRACLRSEGGERPTMEAIYTQLVLRCEEATEFMASSTATSAASASAGSLTQACAEPEPVIVGRQLLHTADPGARRRMSL